MAITFFRIILSKKLKKQKNAKILSFLVVLIILTYNVTIYTQYDAARRCHLCLIDLQNNVI
jgi:hypothetical protein